MKIKKNDFVVVTCGKDRGKKGLVIRSIPKERKVVVEKINLLTKHIKKTDKSPGGRIQFEAPISVSNVKIICPECKKSVRVAYEIPQKGKKYRVCKKCNVNLEKPFSKK